MRQPHEAGDKLFVDYAGQMVPIVDPSTGEISQAQIFVAMLGASKYTYACDTASQKATDWVASIIATLDFIGGVPCLLVPDQPRTLRARTDHARFARRTYGALWSARHASTPDQAP